jgi:hypothetical protein
VAIGSQSIRICVRDLDCINDVKVNLMLLFSHMTHQELSVCDIWLITKCRVTTFKRIVVSLLCEQIFMGTISEVLRRFAETQELRFLILQLFLLREERDRVLVAPVSFK